MTSSSRPTTPAENQPVERSVADAELAFNDSAYTDRLNAPRAWWKRALNTQRPFRWNVRRLVETPVLDVGCGVGRNLLHLDSKGVGVDTNQHSIDVARSRGLVVHTADEFSSSEDARLDGYRTLLFAHVLEHMLSREITPLVATYLPYLQPGGRLVILVPQRAGFRRDPTHVEYVDRAVLGSVAKDLGLSIQRLSSFPLPRLAGRHFAYNETIAVLQKRLR